MIRPKSLSAVLAVGGVALASGMAARAASPLTPPPTPVVRGVAEIQKPYLDRDSNDPGYSRWVESTTLGIPVVVETGGYTQSGDTWARTHLSATADAQRGVLRTRFTLTSLGVYDDRSEVGFSKTVRIDPGTSGLVDGDPITLHVLMHVQGSSHAGPPGLDPSLPQSTTNGRDCYNSYGERYLSSTDVKIDYWIRDTSTTPICSEGCFTPAVLGFGYNAHVLYDSFYGAEVNAEWTSDPRPSAVLGGTPLPQAYNGDTNVGYFGAFGWASMDTGVIQLQVPTRIGSFLEMSGSISSLLQTNGQKTTAEAVLDFGHTFDVDLVSSVPGVQIEGEVPSISAVPEPASSALLASGLIGIAIMARRRMRAGALGQAGRLPR